MTACVGLKGLVQAYKKGFITGKPKKKYPTLVAQRRCLEQALVDAIGARQVAAGTAVMWQPFFSRLLRIYRESSFS